MVEEQPRPERRRRGARRAPSGLVPLAQRAAELGMSPAALRRYVKLESVDGRVTREGNRFYVARELRALPKRVRRRGADEATLPGRRAAYSRETTETTVSMEINLDGHGDSQIETGLGMLDHLLAQLTRHGFIDLRVTARGDALPDAHHLVEDVAIALGRALRQAIGEGRGIQRMGHALVPLDEALAQVVVDFSGRGYAVVETQLKSTSVGNLAGELIGHFLERLALEGGLTLHASVLAGSDPHHKAEALFKALARALRQAVELDPRAAGEVPSTKGTVSA